MAQRSLRDFITVSKKRKTSPSTDPTSDESDDNSEHQPDLEVRELEPGRRSPLGQTLTPKVICTAECCSALEPVQITDTSALQLTRKLQGEKWRQFSPEWYKTYPWLVLCTTRSKVFCSYCRSSKQKGLLTEKIAGGGDAFLTTGFENWKKARESFVQHEKSAIHREAVLKRELMKQPSVIVHVSNQAKQEQKLNQDMLLRQLSSLRYLLRQGLAIRGHVETEGNLMQLLLLRSDDCSGLKQWLEAKKYLSHEILSELMQLMAHSVLREIFHEIREATVFALIADEATDVSRKEQLCVSIRWVDDNFNIYEEPLEFINVPMTDSSTLTTTINDCLVRFSLPISQCRGQAYDGATNMLGHINGVAAQIQKHEPAAVYVHCLAHCTNLCLQTVGKQVLPVRDALDLVMEVSQLIRFSPKRPSLFQSMQSQFSSSTPSLKPLCPTRWTVRTSAIQSVLTNYEVLCDTLCKVNEEGRDEYAIKAGGILNVMEKFCTYFGLKLSHLIFSATEQLSLNLQGKDTSIQEAVQASKLALAYLQRQRSDEAFDRFYDRTIESSKDLTSEPTLPRYRKRPQRIDDGEPAHRFDSTKAYFRQQYFEALDVVHGELSRRFQQKRGVPVAAVIEKVLLDAANGTVSDSCDLPDDLKLYAKDIDIPHLKTELQMLPDLIKAYNENNPTCTIRKVTNIRTLGEIMNDVSSSKRIFRDIFKLIRIFLTIPVTTATAERSFPLYVV